MKKMPSQFMSSVDLAGQMPMKGVGAGMRCGLTMNRPEAQAQMSWMRRTAQMPGRELWTDAVQAARQAEAEAR